MTLASPLSLRLFMEGVEVPIISAQVNVSAGAPSTASIQVVPTDSIFNLLPRTSVHVFYLDKTSVDQALINDIQDEIAEGEEEQATARNRFIAAEKDYKLLFAGEVIGYNYTKNSDSRSVVLQCMDLSSYWDTCYQWFADYSVGGDGLTDRQHNFVGAGSSKFNNITSGHQSVIAEILTSKPKNPDYQNVKGLMGGLIHLFESIGGVRPSKDGSFKGYHGVNDFFTVAELRYNLTGMIGAVEEDTTSARMYSNKAFRHWMKLGMTSLGDLVSYRDLIRHVGQKIFHDVYPNPCAFYTNPKRRRDYETVSQLVETPSGKVAKEFLTAAKSKLESVVLTMQDAVAAAQTEDSTTTITPFTVEVQALATLVFAETIDLIQEAIDELEKAISELRDSSAPDQSEFTTRVRFIANDAVRILRRFNRAATQTTAGGTDYLVTTQFAETSINLLKEAVDELDKLLSRRKRRNITRKTKDVLRGEHLYNQLVLPETFFTPPPRCNILFPDQYFSMTYSRNFMREPTRLACHGGLAMISGGRRSAKMLGKYYLAPNIRSVNGQLLREALGHNARVLLPHEVHSGIVPKFEWVSDGHRWGVRAANAVGNDSFRDKIHYVQRLANFQFYMHRWGARQMQVEAVFSPNLVCGFPLLVMDRSAPSPDALARMTTTLNVDSSQTILPTAFLGKVVGMTHNVNQAGGTTSVSLSHCRTHRGLDDEFMGALARKEFKLDRESEIYNYNIIRNEREVSDEAKKVLGLWLTNNLGINSRVGRKTVKSLYISDDRIELVDDQIGHLGVDKVKYGKKVIVEGDTIETTYINQDGSTSRDQLTEQLEFTEVQVPKFISVEWEFSKFTGKYIVPDTPAEVLLLPGWYSKVWRPENIGQQVHLPLLGVTAVTDDTGITSDASLTELLGASFDLSGLDEDFAVPEVEVEVTDAVIGGTIDVVKAENGQVTLKVKPPEGKLEAAIDTLTLLYGAMRSRGMNMHEFASSYTRRPIANMVEVLGSSDLFIDSSGEVQEGLEGFHSRSFGDYNVDVKFVVGGDGQPVAGQNALVGLIPEDAKEGFKDSVVKGADPPGSREIPPEIDPRGRARQRVKAYMAELQLSRGLLGA